MRSLAAIAAGVVLSAILALTTGGGTALASFHCMRIHAVMAGFNGNNNIQFVELRQNTLGQNLVAGHQVAFFDGAGTLKAVFTFPSNVTNGSTGDSILIATQEFNANATGGAADFVFSNANTVGMNGGDPLHPVQGPSGKVQFAPDTMIASCGGTLPPDSVAYGTATADPGFGSAAVALPSPPDNRALRLSNLNLVPGDNSTNYSLQPVATSAFMVAPGNLATDFTTPRNNGRAVLKLAIAAPPSVGGIAEAPDLAPPDAAATSGGGIGNAWYAALAAALALAAAASGGWYAYRRARR